MKILIISGFLGAGKTRFIQYMAKRTGKTFAIVENEFGQKNIDADLLDESSQKADQPSIWELSEGCICCSLKLDFTQSVLTIANALDPDYLVVEPSGVAHLSKILQQLSKICYERIQLLAPIVLVDVERFQFNRREFGSYFEDQLYAAGTVALSKSEAFSSTQYQDILRSLDLPDTVHAPIGHYENWSDLEWDQLFRKFYDPSTATWSLFEEKKNASPERPLTSWSSDQIQWKSVDSLIAFCDTLLTEELGYVIRAKGILQLGSFWVHFELVNGSYLIEGREDGKESKLVVIGEDLKKKKLQQWVQGGSARTHPDLLSNYAKFPLKLKQGGNRRINKSKGEAIRFKRNIKGLLVEDDSI